MKRRDFLKSTAGIAIATASTGLLAPSEALAAAESLDPDASGQKPEPPGGEGPLIISSPMLQNFAETSAGVAFAVSDLANGFVVIGRQPDLSDGRKVMCGGFRVTDVNDRVMLVRLTGLLPATRYYYRIGADRISYKGGYKMKVLGTEEDHCIYSFTTAGKGARAHFCVINDTHARMDTFARATDKIASLSPSCVVWNGDACNTEETIEDQMRIFLTPDIPHKDYAASIPYLFCPGNHDDRGWANRHLERVWMFRQPEERSSRDWDLGRNFAVRLGDIALIGLDTAEDKVDSNPKFAGLFNSAAYREAQTEWLRDALKRKDIARAPFLVAFCHIPLADDNPRHNPGDVFPADSDPAYSTDYALWQRTCAGLWGPLLDKARCQLLITAHQHCYRYLAPDGSRRWAEIIGGSPELGYRGKGDKRVEDSSRFPTLIEGLTENGELKILVHNLLNGEIQDTFNFKKR